MRARACRLAVEHAPLAGDTRSGTARCGAGGGAKSGGAGQCYRRRRRPTVRSAH